MQQISDWLESLGMSEYAERFADNDIDFAILGDLTDQDLERIGVTSLGIAESYCVRLPISEGQRRAYLRLPSWPLNLPPRERRTLPSAVRSR